MIELWFDKDSYLCIFMCRFRKMSRIRILRGVCPDDYNITILRGDVPNFIAVFPMGGLSCPKICIAFLMDMDSP